jgi:hypothetical protein
VQQPCADRQITGAALRSDAGAAFVITLLVMAVTLVMGLGLATSGVTELDISGNYRNRATAYYAADSGLERTAIDLAADSAWIYEILDPITETLLSPFPTSVTFDSTTVSLSVDGNGDAVPGYYPFGSSLALGDGSFTREIYLPPTLSSSGGDLVLTFRTRSTGTGGTGELSTQVVRADLNVLISPVHGPWDNAVFADAGAAGNAINGHVAVRGSVHVIGNQSAPPTISFGGTGDIRNSYLDADSWFGADVATKLPPLETVEINGVAAATLEAIIRARYADINVTGTADIGLANDDSNTLKETLDAVRADGSVTPAHQVHADEWDDYDTTDLEFPTLADPYTDPNTGVVWATHEEFLDTNSLTISESEISANTPPFAYADGSGNSIAWDPATLTLSITGIIKVNGVLRLGRPHGQPGMRGVHYAGTGTLYSTDDIHVDGFMEPVGDYITGGDNIGLIAEDDVLIDEASQVNVFGAIYGQDHIRVSKQTAIAGAMVSEWFDMGTNVPGVFHVPILSDNLPPGMPGGPAPLGVQSIEIANWYQEAGS